MKRRLKEKQTRLIQEFLKKTNRRKVKKEEVERELGGRGVKWGRMNGGRKEEEGWGERWRTAKTSSDAMWFVLC